jgi:hypothetical protein
MRIEVTSEIGSTIALVDVDVASLEWEVITGEPWVLEQEEAVNTLVKGAWELTFWNTDQQSRWEERQQSRE